MKKIGFFCWFFFKLVVVLVGDNKKLKRVHSCNYSTIAVKTGGCLFVFINFFCRFSFKMRESQALMNKLFWMKKVLFLDHMWSANVCIFENTEQYDNKVVNDKERLKSEGQLNSFCVGKRQDKFFAVVFLLSFSFGDHPFFGIFFLVEIRREKIVLIREMFLKTGREGLILHKGRGARSGRGQCLC